LVDLNDPTYVAFDYVERIIDVVDTAFDEGVRITAIHVGGAGMTIPRYIAHVRPTSAQIVLEPDATLTEAVREVAPLQRNSGIKVRPQDGVTGLAAFRDDHADLIVIDAFAGSGVPPDLATEEWFKEVRRVLKPDGTMSMNLTDLAPFRYSRRVVAGIATHFSNVIVGAEPATWKGRRFGNVVVSAGAGVDPYVLTRRAAGGVFPYRLIYELELSRWLGKAQPFTTQDSQVSPAPSTPPMFA
jgi:hypothetical protein